MPTKFFISTVCALVLIHVTHNSVFGRPQHINYPTSIPTDQFQPIAAATEKPLTLRSVPTKSSGHAPEYGYKESSFNEQSKAGAKTKQVDGAYETIGESEPIISQNTSSSHHECTITKYDPNRFPPYYTADCNQDDLKYIEDERIRRVGPATANSIENGEYRPRPDIENTRFNAGPASSGFSSSGFRPPAVPFNYDPNMSYRHFDPRIGPPHLQYPHPGFGPINTDFNSRDPRFNSVNPGFYPTDSSSLNPGFRSPNPGFRSTNPGFNSGDSSLTPINPFPQTSNTHFSQQSYRSSRIVPDFGAPSDLEFEYQSENGDPFLIHIQRVLGQN